ILRLANCAFFAQRQPITNLDRSCVLLGVDRLKSVALGFYLSRAAAGDPRQSLSRRIWGQSVYRACLSAELARQLAPTRAAESFIIGLLLDAGIPLVARLLGRPALAILHNDDPPARQFKAESDHLPFTHVD